LARRTENGTARENGFVPNYVINSTLRGSYAFRAGHLGYATHVSHSFGGS